MLNFNGHNFTLNRRRDMTCYWECVKRRSPGIKCRARIVTSNGAFKSLRNSHNHS